MEINDLLLTGLKIYQDSESFKFSIDSLLLADFVELKPKDKVLEFGSGNGAILLYLSQKFPNQMLGIELIPEMVTLSNKSLELNHLEKRITFKELDIKKAHLVLGANRYDCVISNPPYFKKGRGLVNDALNKTNARHEQTITFKEIVSEAKKVLVDGGRFYFIHRAEWISEIIKVLADNNFGLFSLRNVYPKKTSDSALLLLVEARLNRNSETKILKPLYIYDGEEYSEEIKAIYKLRKG